MKLLLDVGNTRLKWCTQVQGSFGEVYGCDYRKFDWMQDLQQGWESMPTPDTIAIASVSQPEVVANLARLFRIIWPVRNPIIAQSGQSAFGVTNAYSQPEKLGVDRWLALLAAYHYYPGPACVVDCGTAITVDAIKKEGNHLGGLICPGLRLMKHSLASNTADLSLTDRQGEVCLAQDTQAAIANGSTIAAIGLIEQVMSQLGEDYRLILTGGDAQCIARLLSRSFILDSALVLKGLALYCQRVVA